LNVVYGIACAEEPEKSLAATLDVYAFPKQGQSASQQSTDEASCYQWAVSISGVDPFESAKQVQAAQEQAMAGQQQAAAAGQGTGARGALRGAAGALISELASDDAGEGAAWVAAPRSNRRCRGDGRRPAAGCRRRGAFFGGVCLEGKDYLVKY
jgi:hypothetical protein